jgi:hypothetical protein
MLHHFNCPHRYPYLEWTRDPSYSLIFNWDDETGEITGRDAEQILATFRRGYAKAHPIPSVWPLTSTRSRTDIAAVVGLDNELPPELADAYPQFEDDVDDRTHDEDGNVIVKMVY